MPRTASIEFETRRRRRVAVAVAALCLSLFTLAFSLSQFAGLAFAQAVRPPESAVESAAPAAPGTPPKFQTSDESGAEIPGNSKGVDSDAQLWREVRHGESFTVSIPDKKAAYLVQSGGEDWRALRTGPLPLYGAYVLAGFAGLIVLFYLVRGRVRIDAGWSGQRIERFNGLERFGHWLLAGSFVVLALTGLNVLYGREVLRPLIGPEAFSQITIAGKWAHNNVGWAFMLGLALVFVMWVLHNLPSWRDVVWLARGGGLLTKGVHLNARKFNAGQKIVFWATVLGGLSLSLSGIALLFPFETAMMSKTFTLVNSVAGTSLPVDLTPVQEMRLQSLWHSSVALVMIGIILAHIYIGTLGMQGAFAAMGSGQVDMNWAKEHHNLWVEEVQAKRSGGSGAAATPAE